jgi:glycerate 2-kinase
VIARARAESALQAAIASCDPEVRVHEAMARVARRSIIGVAVGKSAIAMARGAGPVVRGICVAIADDGWGLPDGWQLMLGSHPEPDNRSVAAAEAVIELVKSATAEDVVLALVSGGASALIEKPIAGVSLDELRLRVRAVIASGAKIREINEVRKSLSAIKAGKLARMSAAQVYTLAVSDVVGDDLEVIGSAPTVTDRKGDHAAVIMPVAAFGEAAALALNAHRLEEPMIDDVHAVAERLSSGQQTIVAWGEPTVKLPSYHGEGGRAQQLALELAKRLRDGDRSALVVGSDGIDGFPPKSRPTPAGAFVDGDTWENIKAAGIDPHEALARCDAGTALAAVGALVVTGPTGINHADLMIVG